MKLLFVSLSLSIVLGGCVSISNKGVTGISPVDSSEKKVTIVRDQPTRASVLPVLEEWFSENDYHYTIVESREDTKASDNVFTYRVWFGWDLSQYMSRAEMEVFKDEDSIGFLEFDALQYGVFGKFGDTTARLKTLMDALFNKMSEEEANKRLGDL